LISLLKLPKPPPDGGPKLFQIAIAASMVISTLSAVYASIKTSLTMEAVGTADLAYVPKSSLS
jgi:hypothetical protein